ncbi:MAG: hypothetical protein KC493_07655 [Bacteriovoracaceae bacterium]|nr:hypothetical protein [Bacteriovoracaceae bacterium]
MHLTQATIIGFGSQAKAWASNLKDSGLEVHILLRSGSRSLRDAKSHGYKVLTFDQDLSGEKGPFIVLTPDHTHHEILSILKNKLEFKNSCFIYAHGYSFLRHKFDELYPESHHLLLAPKAIASEVRKRYLNSERLVAVLADPEGKSQETLSELVKSLGITKVINSSFQDETWADLFSEQTLLCSLLPYGAKKSYDFLVEKGINPEVAFTECWMEVKLIADAMLDYGPEGFFNLISPNALIGGEKATSTLFDNEYQTKLDSLWSDIKSGKFDQEIDNTDVSKLREKVLKDWSNSTLSKTYKSFFEDTQ